MDRMELSIWVLSICPKGVFRTVWGRDVICGGMPFPTRNIAKSLELDCDYYPYSSTKHIPDLQIIAIVEEQVVGLQEASLGPSSSVSMGNVSPLLCRSPLKILSIPI